MRLFFILTLLFCYAVFMPNLYAETEVKVEENADILDSAEIMLGERLFLETRFAQYFKIHVDQTGNVNTSLKKGDPALDKTVRFFGLPPYQLPFTEGPYAGQSFNCRNCHLVDEHIEQAELGMRTYADFASRSPVPTREDGLTTTVRNTPTLVDVSRERNNFILHTDGEFSSLRDLIRGTLTDRNLGWLPGENQFAIEHICKVVRDDDGSSALAKEFGGLSYTEAFSGTKTHQEAIDSAYLIPEKLRIDVKKASCNKVFDAIANMIAIYIEDLVFAEDRSIISPYDLFLELNELPTHANKGETNLAYSKRLMQTIQGLHKQNKLRFVEKNPNTPDGKFQFHDQSYEFGLKQLEGMKIFFAQKKTQQENDGGAVGNCIACHPAPHFTDHGLHNTGITQIEYDAIHGQNTFNKLKIPNILQRNKKAELYLPATHQHPKRKGVFRSIPSHMNTMAADLGSWNILYNNDYINSQQSIKNLICGDDAADCKSDDEALQLSIAAFKTPSLRDLGHSAPYMHNGQIGDLHAVTSFYLAVSVNTRQGQFRNPDEDIAKINILPKDLNPLVLFLTSLYEDYN